MNQCSIEAQRNQLTWGGVPLHGGDLGTEMWREASLSSDYCHKGPEAKRTPNTKGDREVGEDNGGILN